VHRLLLRRRIEVAEAVVDVNGRLVFRTPKNHQTRSVPVPASSSTTWLPNSPARRLLSWRLPSCAARR
jgi:hypothetical protein